MSFWLVYDLQSGVLDLPDFYFTGDDYRYRFESEAKQRFLDLLRERFNSGVTYKGRSLKWDTVIQEKANELGRYLIGRSPRLDLSGPATVLERTDNRAMREAILNLTQAEARERGIGKSTYHYVRSRALALQSLKVYDPVRNKLHLRQK